MPWRQYARTDPRRGLLHLRAILGRRGSFLALLGVVWIMQGVAALTAPESGAYLLLADGSAWRAAVWVATGAVALVYSVRPQGEDALGFLALYIMAAYRAIAYGLGLLLWALPGGRDGDPRGIIGLLSWGVVIIAILIIAGWEEGDDVQPRQPHQGSSR